MLATQHAIGKTLVFFILLILTNASTQKYASYGFGHDHKKTERPRITRIRADGRVDLVRIYPRASAVQTVSFFACREEIANLVSCVFVFFVDILVRNFPDREATDGKRMSTKNA